MSDVAVCDSMPFPYSSGVPNGSSSNNNSGWPATQRTLMHSTLGGKVTKPTASSNAAKAAAMRLQQQEAHGWAGYNPIAMVPGRFTASGLPSLQQAFDNSASSASSSSSSSVWAPINTPNSFSAWSSPCEPMDVFGGFQVDNLDASVVSSQLVEDEDDVKHQQHIEQSPAKPACAEPTQSKLLMNLIDKEDAFMPVRQYLKRVQREEITPDMRRDVLESLLRLTSRFCEHGESFAHAVQIFDRFLSKVRVRPEHLQLIGVASFLIASKMCEAWNTHASPKELCIAADHLFTVNDLTRMEKIIINKHAWEVSSVTPHLFLHQIRECYVGTEMSMEFLDSNVIPNAESLVERALCHYDFCEFRPSALAASAMAFAFLRAGVMPPVHLYTLVDATPCDTDIHACLELLKSMIMEVMA